jgi:hypothetical protein
MRDSPPAKGVATRPRGSLAGHPCSVSSPFPTAPTGWQSHPHLPMRSAAPPPVRCVRQTVPSRSVQSTWSAVRTDVRNAEMSDGYEALTVTDKVSMYASTTLGAEICPVS